MNSNQKQLKELIDEVSKGNNETARKLLKDILKRKTIEKIERVQEEMNQ